MKKSQRFLPVCMLLTFAFAALACDARKKECDKFTDAWAAAYTGQFNTLAEVDAAIVAKRTALAGVSSPDLQLRALWMAQLVRLEASSEIHRSYEATKGTTAQLAALAERNQKLLEHGKKMARGDADIQSYCTR
jgi:uncharacterized membrane protein